MTATLEELAISMRRLGINHAKFTAAGDPIELTMGAPPEMKPVVQIPRDIHEQQAVDRHAAQKAAERRQRERQRDEDAMLFAASEGMPVVPAFTSGDDE